ncbi:MAG: heat-inducible transcriptional repressor HrcA [Clostridiales bacterium]|jgi:heat-inducible transcriptional repressor|nr:heat-inducible transcriptional repressor HrcA [Clostridiales bacterium]
MEIDPRKKQILHAIIESYIETGEPVGSRTLSKIDGFTYSPATIRNEMSDLEDLGLLEQPHISAGRIPTDLGYRFYVDQLMHKNELNPNEISFLNSAIDDRVRQIDSLLGDIAKMYTKVSQYTIFTQAPTRIQSIITDLDIIPLNSEYILLVVATNDKSVKTTQVKTDKPYTIQMIERLSGALKHAFIGKDLSDITLDKLKDIQTRVFATDNYLPSVLDVLFSRLKNDYKSSFHLRGAANLLNFPDYNNIAQVRDLISFLDDEENLIDVINSVKDPDDNDEIYITIGKENRRDELKGSSVVISKYKTADNRVGAIGLIGPTRMNYAKEISFLDYISKKLESLEKGDDNK